MKALQKILNFYVFSNIHVGIATACLVLVSKANVESSFITYSSFFVFFSTVFAYHFIRVFENAEAKLNSMASYLKKQPKELLSVGIFAFAGALFFGFLIGIHHLWILIPAAFITFWYAIPLFKYKGIRISLRNYPSIKIISIAFVWAISTVLFPLQENLADFQVWLEFVQRFFLIMALVIPFDIRDLNKDVGHLQTLPQIKGIAGAKIIGIQYLVLFFILGFFKKPLEVTTVASGLSIFILSLLLLVKSKENQSKYYASFWVESVPIVWLVLLLVFKAIE